MEGAGVVAGAGAGGFGRNVSSRLLRKNPSFCSTFDSLSVVMDRTASGETHDPYQQSIPSVFNGLGRLARKTTSPRDDARHLQATNLLFVLGFSCRDGATRKTPAAA